MCFCFVLLSFSLEILPNLCSFVARTVRTTLLTRLLAQQRGIFVEAKHYLRNKSAITPENPFAGRVHCLGHWLVLFCEKQQCLPLCFYLLVDSDLEDNVPTESSISKDRANDDHTSAENAPDSPKPLLATFDDSPLVYAPRACPFDSLLSSFVTQFLAGVFALLWVFSVFYTWVDFDCACLDVSGHLLCSCRNVLFPSVNPTKPHKRYSIPWGKNESWNFDQTLE